MDITQFSQINPPQRLLMGPGPINADPRVLRQQEELERQLSLF